MLPIPIQQFLKVGIVSLQVVHGDCRAKDGTESGGKRGEFGTCMWSCKKKDTAGLLKDPHLSRFATIGRCTKELLDQ